MELMSIYGVGGHLPPVYSFRVSTRSRKPGKIKFSGKSWNFEKPSKVLELFCENPVII